MPFVYQAMFEESNMNSEVNQMVSLKGNFLFAGAKPLLRAVP